MPWEVELHEEVDAWYMRLVEADPETAELVAGAIDLLEDVGPALGRPAVDTLEGSDYSNMKELRPGSKGSTEIRVIFAFDPERTAILLVAGDKSGNWKGWYKDNIPVADQRYRDHLAQL